MRLILECRCSASRRACGEARRRESVSRPGPPARRRPRVPRRRRAQPCGSGEKEPTYLEFLPCLLRQLPAKIGLLRLPQLLLQRPLLIRQGRALGLLLGLPLVLLAELGHGERGRPQASGLFRPFGGHYRRLRPPSGPRYGGMSLGFLTESALIPKKAKAIEGVSKDSVRSSSPPRRLVDADRAVPPEDDGTTSCGPFGRVVARRTRAPHGFSDGSRGLRQLRECALTALPSPAEEASREECQQGGGGFAQGGAKKAEEGTRGGRDDGGRNREVARVQAAPTGEERAVQQTMCVLSPRHARVVSAGSRSAALPRSGGGPRPARAGRRGGGRLHGGL